MMHRLNTSWFSQPKRHGLDKYVQEQLNEANSQLVDYNLYDQSNEGVVYKVSVLGGWVSVLQFIKYLTLEPIGRRPWMIRKSITQPLALSQFKEYIVETIHWLNAQPPNTNYAALVHIQTVINFLTTMEISNATRRNTTK